MAEYQQLVIDQFIEQNRERRLNPRKTNDLPVEIIGKGAFWRNPGPSPQGNARPSSYHVTIDDTDYPIEFVNKQWCYLVWDDEEKFKGYWVKPSNLISQGQNSLGWIGNQLEIATPTALSQYRERAESTSTQGEQISPKKESPVDDDGIDVNPFQTELLAQAFTENPVFHDIAESVDPAQSREHYLPTTIPWTERLKPTHVNPQPIHACATTSGETIAATTEATKLITNAIKIDGVGVHAVPVPHGPDRSVLRVPYPCRSKLLLTTWTDGGWDGLGPSKAVSVRPSRPYRRLDGYIQTFSGLKFPTLPACNISYIKQPPEDHPPRYRHQRFKVRNEPTPNSIKALEIFDPVPGLIATESPSTIFPTKSRSFSTIYRG